MNVARAGGGCTICIVMGWVGPSLANDNGKASPFICYARCTLVTCSDYDHIHVGNTMVLDSWRFLKDGCCQCHPTEPLDHLLPARWMIILKVVRTSPRKKKWCYHQHVAGQQHWAHAEAK